MKATDQFELSYFVR